MVKRLVLYSALIVLGLFVAGCSARKTDTATSAAAVAPAVPVVETRVVTETLKIPVTVVVTATPVPTPVYTSKINAASGTLVYPIASEPASLDPQEADDEVSTLVAAQLYEGLFDLREDGSSQPAAAQDLIGVIRQQNLHRHLAVGHDVVGRAARDRAELRGWRLPAA